MELEHLFQSSSFVLEVIYCAGIMGLSMGLKLLGFIRLSDLTFLGGHSVAQNNILQLHHLNSGGIVDDFISK
ncbi:hypothetical protein JMG10_02610 [Nostoc ellipsosporum NOK]|nr:hypothetical protein [Nostoc ellipsosporum NOK]